jgi:hypothetical protein
LNEIEAKERLVEMLESYTAGSILQLLGEVLADREDEQSTLVEHTLIVVGMGIDAALPT